MKTADPMAFFTGKMKSACIETSHGPVGASKGTSAGALASPTRSTSTSRALGQRRL